MTTGARPLGRRERNKQAKLDRITEAAAALFARHGVDDVTTQQIADAADIGAGTLFLYIRNKGELLLLVQNAHYAEALAEGERAATAVEGTLDAIVALLRPVVACNRAQVDNGRTYLREMVFGDPAEPQHARALSIVAQTQEAVAGLLARTSSVGATEAAALAQVVSAVMFVEMASSPEPDVDVVTDRVRRQIGVVLGLRG
ncbi:TetR family transcriptional regulator [Serinibacter arcticus]|uniref:TetR family transcriptional regulator n=1 Tax=Serinibacter arcticus TaxID=1655435 RepID=A0A2U1ZTJ1_9MICO|nr:helix-turn-helix domain-containing protein [Serinibacter arcticus]PWD50242.1 TetR family transcriptional regulator [Serinibacter arcticus]